MAERVLVTVDGVVRDPDAPVVHADDLAAVRGDGVFETILVRDGAACTLEPHLARLARSAEALDLPRPDLASWRDSIAVAIGEWGCDHEGIMRLVYSRGRESGGGPTGYLTVGSVPDRVRRARRDGISVCTLARGISVDSAAAAPWQLLGAKTLSYATNMAALRYAHTRGTDDVIFTSSEGFVLEGPRSTVLVARGRTLITPPADHGILPGTTQQALFEVAADHRFRCVVDTVRPADLIAADGLWLLSSVMLAARVHTLDGLVRPAPAIADEVSTLVDRAVAAGER